MLLLGVAVMGMSAANVAAASPPKIVAVGDIACQSFNLDETKIVPTRLLTMSLHERFGILGANGPLR